VAGAAEVNCKCDDGTHDTLGTTVWHRAFCNWYDHDRSGHTIRAHVWGWVADRLVSRA
jgi:hypothetical protein